MNEQILEAIVERLDNQKAQMDNLVSEIKELKQTSGKTISPDCSEGFKETKEEFISIQKSLAHMQFLGGLAKQLNIQLLQHTVRLNKPLKQEIVHHHYFNKGMIVSFVLLLLFLFSMSLLYKSYDRTEEYRSNDLKYRYLKLTSDSTFYYNVKHIDSLYRTNAPEMKEQVEKAERKQEEQLHLLQLATEKENVSKKTRKQVSHDKRNNH